MFDEGYTDECLRQMAEQVVGMPVTVEFDPDNVVGEVTSASVDDTGLRIGMTLTDDVQLEGLTPPSITFRQS